MVVCCTAYRLCKKQGSHATFLLLILCRKFACLRDLFAKGAICPLCRSRYIILKFYFRICYSFIFAWKKVRRKTALLHRSISFLFQNLHNFSAASGNHIAFAHMQQLVADGAVDVTFLFSPDHAVQASFQFIFHCYPSFFKRNPVMVGVRG